MNYKLKITFVEPAQVDDELNYSYYGIWPDTTVFNVGFNFKAIRTYPGEVEIGINAVEQAINFYDAFVLDYLPGGNWAITRNINEVIIECLNGSEIFDAALNVGATYALLNYINVQNDNMIHDIIFTPRKYNIPTSLFDRNFLVTENDFLILTEDNKKIRL